jgi:hypothetical protein
MTTITRASREWATRPYDERFLSLHELADFKTRQRTESRTITMNTRNLTLTPSGDDDVLLYGFEPTNWAFGQLAGIAGAPARYLRTLPPTLVADCLNHGLHERDDEVALLTRDDRRLGAATGTGYGRVWDADVVQMLIDRFGDGVTGDWRVPGEFGKAVTVDRQNTTIYASDRDMFVFLADEKNRIEVPNRRNGEPGTLARGFFVWNSEVGSMSLGAAFFTFDYVCCNRMIWGVGEYIDTRIRHSLGAPERWLNELVPVLESYSTSSSDTMLTKITAAQTAKVDEDWLVKHFGATTAGMLNGLHFEEEGRPIETVWDASVAMTARARTVEHQDARVTLEREAGKLLSSVTA